MRSHTAPCCLQARHSYQRQPYVRLAGLHSYGAANAWPRSALAKRPTPYAVCVQASSLVVAHQAPALRLVPADVA